MVYFIDLKFGITLVLCCMKDHGINKKNYGMLRGKSTLQIRLMKNL